MSNRGKNVLFRADADLVTATGHVRRLMPLVDAYRNIGAECFFVTWDHEGHDIEFIKQRFDDEHLFVLENSKVHELMRQPQLDKNSKPTKHKYMPIVDTVDLSMTLDAIADHHFDLLVLDQYGIGDSWIKPFKETRPETKVLVVDDIGNSYNKERTLRHADAVYLHKNTIMGGLMYTSITDSRNTKLFLNNKYKIISPKFAAVGQSKRQQWQNNSADTVPAVKRAAVTFGGVDAPNQTKRIMRLAYSVPALKQLELDVIVGGPNPHRDEIEALCEEYGYNFHYNINNMPEVIGQCDIMIGAYGGTAQEAVAAGTPPIGLAIAENQIESGNFMEKRDLGCYLGPHDQISDQALISALVDFIKDPKKLREIAIRGTGFFDGRGADRIAEESLTL